MASTRHPCRSDVASYPIIYNQPCPLSHFLVRRFSAFILIKPMIFIQPATAGRITHNQSNIHSTVNFHSSGHNLAHFIYFYSIISQSKGLLNVPKNKSNINSHAPNNQITSTNIQIVHTRFIISFTSTAQTSFAALTTKETCTTKCFCYKMAG